MLEKEKSFLHPVGFPDGSPDLRWINRRKKKTIINYIPEGNMASYPLEYEAQGQAGKLELMSQLSQLREGEEGRGWGHGDGETNVWETNACYQHYGMQRGLWSP